jgi:hypothetical protein
LRSRYPFIGMQNMWPARQSVVPGIAAIGLAGLIGLLAVPVAAYEEKDLQQLVSTGKCANCDLHGVDLINRSLTASDLRRVNLRDSDLKGLDLSGSQMERADLRRSNLERANLTGAQMPVAIWPERTWKRQRWSMPTCHAPISAALIWIRSICAAPTWRMRTCVARC